jgi:polysaccharide export outer membrane protein
MNRFFLLAGTVLVVGCNFPLPPAHPSEAAGFEQVAPMPGLDSDPAVPFTIMVGDELRIATQSVENQTQEGFVVDELGHIRVPLAGDIEVAGLTLTQASARIQTALRQFDRVIVVDVSVAEPNGHAATVLGAITEPGRVPLPPGTRLADLMAMVGGPLQSEEGGDPFLLADLGGARLMRRGQSVPVSVELAMAGDPRHNVRVRPGDHLYVPPVRGQRIIVLGKVDEPQVFAHREGMRLTEALARAGGVTVDGDNQDIRIVRGDLRAPVIYEANLLAIIDGDTHDVILAPGDIVFVTTHWIAHLGEVLDRLSPILSTGTAVGLSVLVSQR